MSTFPTSIAKTPSAVNYDGTGGPISTPGGIGKFVAYSPETGMATVEVDWEYLVEFSGDKCFPLQKEGKMCRSTQKCPLFSLG